MKLRHSLVVTLMAAGLVAFSGGLSPAGAVDHNIPPSQGSGRLGNSVVSPGQATSFCGSGFRPNSPVSVTVDGAYYKSVMAGADGSFCASVRVSSAGQHTLRARGITAAGGVRVVSAMLTVRSGGFSGSDSDAWSGTDDAWSGTDEDSLPFTGSEVGLIAAGAVLLLGAGAGARIVGRRRRSTTA